MGDEAIADFLFRQGIRDERVLAAMASLDRHRFVPEPHQHLAREDAPLPIGHGQTISQPYIVAYMTEALAPQPHERVLEIGTGSGYQAAVLARLCREVYSVEIVPALYVRARALLAELGLDNVHTRLGDGYRGWPEAAPFDAVLLTAAPPEIPPPLVAQLRPGGRLLAPVGAHADFQQLVLLERVPGDGQLRVRRLLPVRFVPMTGEAQESPP